MASPSLVVAANPRLEVRLQGHPQMLAGARVRNDIPATGGATRKKTKQRAPKHEYSSGTQTTKGKKNYNPIAHTIQIMTERVETASEIR